MLGVLVLLCLFVSLPVHAAGHRFTLVIDAGHGGNDAGALGSFSKEKNINLKVALAFGRLVEQNCPDVKVIYTRKTDVFIPLNERANIANRAKADLFVSVHTNALPQGKVARGFEVYTLGMHRAADNLEVAKRENSVILVEKDYKQRYEGFDPNSAESYIIFEFMQDKNMAKSVELAKMVQQEVCAQANRPNKGVHQAGFLVLRATSMPSCLIELGFITTADEERLLNSESGIAAHARGIFRAFERYKKKYDEGIVVPFQAPRKETVEIPTIVPKEAPLVSPQGGKPRADSRVSQLPPQGETQGGAPTRLSDLPPQREGRGGANLPSPSETQGGAPTRVSDLPPQGEGRGGALLPPQGEGRGGAAPVFKVQVFLSNKPLPKTDRNFKGETNVDSYKEDGLVKYTIGASTDYNEIYRLRKSLLAKFPQAFIIAFRNGQKMNVQEAIQEFKSKKASKK